jgi:multiple sugar transport system permease protein
VLLACVFVVPMANCVLAGTAADYAELFRDRTLHRSAANTLLFASASVSLEMLFGLAFALLLHQTFKLRGMVRAIALIPWALPTAVMAMSWRWIFNDTYGVASDLLTRLGLAERGVAWLGQPGTAFAALVVADVWKTTPFVTIILLAGLQSIPRDLYEAMSVDGAGAIRRFLLVTIPLLRPAIALALTFRLIQALGIFDLIWVLTGGGPADSTKTVALYIYDNVFRYLKPGYGAALTVAVTLSVLAVALGAGALVRGRSRS